MKALTYIPGSDAEKGVWMNNFDAKLPSYAGVLGLSPAEIAAVHDDNTAFQYVIGMVEMYRQTLSNLISYKNMLKHASGTQHIGAFPVPQAMATTPVAVAEGVFDRVNKLVARIKNSLGYSDNIGADLGIISPSAQVIDVATLQPELVGRVDVGRPRLKWVKGYADAIDLYADRNDGNGFVLLGRLLKNEYIDVAPLASGKIFDEWKYKAIYVISDEQVGLFSKITNVDVKKI